jgi:hypothetical protein
MNFESAAAQLVSGTNQMQTKHASAAKQTLQKL